MTPLPAWCLWISIAVAVVDSVLSPAMRASIAKLAAVDMSSGPAATDTAHQPAKTDSAPPRFDARRVCLRLVVVMWLLYITVFHSLANIDISQSAMGRGVVARFWMQVDLLTVVLVVYGLSCLAWAGTHSTVVALPVARSRTRHPRRSAGSRLTSSAQSASPRSATGKGTPDLVKHTALAACSVLYLCAVVGNSVPTVWQYRPSLPHHILRGNNEGVKVPITQNATLSSVPFIGGARLEVEAVHTRLATASAKDRHGLSQAELDTWVRGARLHGVWGQLSGSTTSSVGSANHPVVHPLPAHNATYAPAGGAVWAPLLVGSGYSLVDVEQLAAREDTEAGTEIDDGAASASTWTALRVILPRILVQGMAVLSGARQPGVAAATGHVLDFGGRTMQMYAATVLASVPHGTCCVVEVPNRMCAGECERQRRFADGSAAHVGSLVLWRVHRSTEDHGV